MNLPKFHIISKLDDPVSMKLSQQCLDSAANAGIECEIISGVYSNQEELLQENKLTPFKYKDVSRRYTNGVKGCFLSHFLLWKKCLELNEPIGVFEYDALVVRPISPDLLEYKDCLHLGGARLDSKVQQLVKLEPVDNLKVSYSSIKKNFIIGTHSYMLSPSGAEKLINAAYKHGYLFADLHINLNYLNIYQPALDVAIVNPFMQENRKTLSHTLHN